MIRIVRLQDVVDLEGDGGVRSVMVVANDAGLTAEIPVSTEQMALVVKLVQADAEVVRVPKTLKEAPAGVPDEKVRRASPEREESLFSDPGDRVVTPEVDVQQLLDSLQPDPGAEIPGEQGGAGQL